MGAEPGSAVPSDGTWFRESRSGVQASPGLAQPLLFSPSAKKGDSSQGLYCQSPTNVFIAFAGGNCTQKWASAHLLCKRNCSFSAVSSQTSSIWAQSLGISQTHVGTVPFITPWWCCSGGLWKASIDRDILGQQAGGLAGEPPFSFGENSPTKLNKSPKWFGDFMHLVIFGVGFSFFFFF